MSKGDLPFESTHRGARYLPAPALAAGGTSGGSALRRGPRPPGLTSGQFSRLSESGLDRLRTDPHALS
jgi:hypothetical protein